MNSNNRNLRNIGIIAHVDAGKTTVTERILFYTGENHRLGEVHEGTARMDFDPQEQKRGITINSAAVTVHWKGVQVNVIDTPGHIDFNIEVRRSLRVLDGAVVVFDGVAGVEPQTETNWRLADVYGVPRIAFINKLDRVGADFRRVVSMIEERLGVKPLVLQLPIGAKAGYRGMVDLLTLRSWVWQKDDASEPPQVGEVPAELLDLARRERARLVEAAVEQDDDLLEALSAIAVGMPVTRHPYRDHNPQRWLSFRSAPTVMSFRSSRICGPRDSQNLACGRAAVTRWPLNVSSFDRTASAASCADDATFE